MRFNWKTFGVAAVAAALFPSVVACHGESPNGSAYTPTVTTALSRPSVGDFDKAAKHTIVSTCGDRVHIVLAGFKGCRFSEKGYRGSFTIHDRTKGLVGTWPSSGTEDTTFTITGLVVGNGAFVIRSKRGDDLVVRIRVTT